MGGGLEIPLQAADEPSHKEADHEQHSMPLHTHGQGVAAVPQARTGGRRCSLVAGALGLLLQVTQALAERPVRKERRKGKC